MNKRVPRMLFGGIFFFFTSILVFGYLVMLLWNVLIPQIFHITAISYWQAIGLLVLCKILFVGFRHPNHRHFGFGWDNADRFRRRKEWFRKFEEKINSMSPEDKEFFEDLRNKMKQKHEFRGFHDNRDGNSCS